MLQSIKAQQAAAEAQMKHLMQINHAKATALSRALNGDSFTKDVPSTAHSTAKASAARKTRLHPRSGRPLHSTPAAAGQRNLAVAAVANRAKSADTTSVMSRAKGAAHNENSRPDSKHVQARIAKLLGDAKSRLKQDEHSTMTDLLSKTAHGPWFQAEQALRLKGDKRRVMGDERLIKLLTGMQASQELLPSENA